MKSGNSWVPLNKGLKAFLPKDKRPFTKLEASFSLQLDYDEGTGVTVSGYASLWGWNRKKVLKFLDDAGVSIKGSARGSHKGGTIKPQGHEGLHERDMRGTSQGHLKLIDNKHLENEKDMRGTSQGHERDMRGVTTINTNTKTKTKTKSKALSKTSFDGEKFFELAWKAYPVKRGNKQKAKNNYLKTVNGETDHNRIMKALNWYVNDCESRSSIKKNGETFFNQWQVIEQNMVEQPTIIASEQQSNKNRRLINGLQELIDEQGTGRDCIQQRNNGLELCLPSKQS